MRNKTLSLAVSMTVALLMLSACTAETPPAALDIDQIIEGTTEYQRSLLEDGKVTSAEYEKALLARRDCVASTGAVPGDIYQIGNNEQTFDFEITAPTEADMEAIQANADKCLLEYFDDVGSVWAFQSLLSPAERKELQPLVVDCLADAGVNVPADADVKRMSEELAPLGHLSEDVEACVTKYAAFFAIPPQATAPHAGGNP